MAAVGRESRFMPTVKCSTCGLQVEISLMGEHVCAGSGSPAAESTPPMPAASIFGRLMPAFGNPLAQKQQPRAPPQVDTSAANRDYLGAGQLTPVSLSSGSQRSASPQTPNPRAGDSKGGEGLAPQNADNSLPTTTGQSTRPGGYGGLGDGTGNEDPAVPAKGPTKQGLDLMERMNNMTSGPFGASRRPSAAGFGSASDTSRRPSTSASVSGGTFGSGKLGNAPRQNGYGGLGSTSAAADEPPATPNRSETFPRPSDRFAPPPRTPSAPPSSATLPPDGLRTPLDPPAVPDGRVPVTSERQRRPSRGPDTGRAPPPRTNLVRPKTPVVPTINLAAEFGIGNPYHASSESGSSTNSESSSRLGRRPSQASEVSGTSSRSSPPRSLASRSGKSSDPSSLDNLMSDIQSSMDEMRPKQTVVPPLKLPPKILSPRPPPPSARPPRSGERGYDPRIDPAVQNPRLARGRSPLPSPMPTVTTPATPLPEGLAVQTPSDVLSPSTAGPTSPRWTSSPERMEEGPAPPPAPPADADPPRERSRSRQPSSRGTCRACDQPITGKSISSADGRLTGRYHKHCFVCSTCREPFSSTTFYVLDDRPYCELHYHKLNGSLCGSCGRGIEGQYLEDESAVKHHVGCFKCGKCGMALRDGYFEVGGRAYCEKDAWRLVQTQQLGGMTAGGGGGPGPGPGGPRPGFAPHGGPAMGLPGGVRAPPGAASPYNPSRLGPRPRMEKRMTRLGMM